MAPSKSESGQALILIVLAIVGLLGLAGLAVDGGNAYSDRRNAQNAADSAALAAALAKARGQSWNAVGLERAASNGYDNDGAANTVQLFNPPISGPYAGNDQYIQVIITSHVNTYFAPIVGVQQVTNTVEAVTRATPSTTSQMAFGNAVVSLAPHGCDRTWAHGAPAITVIGGGVFTNSDDPNCAFRQNGSGSLTAPSVTVVGGATYNAGHVTPTPNTGAAPIPYPPPIALPKPICTENAVKSGNTLSPGTVNGTFPPNGVTNLQSGVYCVNGNFRLNANDTLTGNGVVIVMQSGGITWNGNAAAELSAPTSGPFAGLLIYQPMSNTSTMTINGNSDMRLTGSILAPAAGIRILGTGAVDGFNSQVIGYTVEFGGTSDGTIRYNDNNNYHAAEFPQLELTK